MAAISVGETFGDTFGFPAGIDMDLGGTRWVDVLIMGLSTLTTPSLMTKLALSGQDVVPEVISRSATEIALTWRGTTVTLRGENFGTDAPVVHELVWSIDGTTFFALRNVTFSLDVVDALLVAWTLGGTNYTQLLILGGDDSIFGTSEADRLIGYGGNDYLAGGGGGDILIGDHHAFRGESSGENFADYIDGGSGADQMSGGIGDDVYIVDDVGDVAAEDKSIAGTASAVNGLNDRVYSVVSYSLAGQYVEHILLIGENAINATGNSLNNHLTGNSAKNTLTGGKGDDWYFIQTAGDKVIEADKEGTDTVFSTVGFSLAGQYVENLFLQGAADINALGNSLDNFLSGNDGINELRGGKGNDSYYVQTLGDRVIEKAGEGERDFVYSTVDFSLSGQFVEELWLVGEDDIDGSGNSLDNTITGNDGKNILRGYGGDDTYYIQTVGDQVIEAKDAGNDTVVSSLTWSLAGQYIENLTLAGDAAINATGNSLDNILTGNSAKNILSGGKGDDTYYVQNADDVVNEATSEGYDRIYSSASYSLAGRLVEELRLTGTAAIDATGNTKDNVLVGNDASNRIYGGAGLDRMTGGGGVDAFIYLSRNDSVAGTSDRIMDLEAHDLIDLSKIDGNSSLNGDQGFQLVSSLTAATTDGAGRAVLRYDAANSWTLLELDATGDGKADSRIVLMGNHLDHANWAW